MRSSQELAGLRERAVQLRRQGKSRRQIKEVLGMVGNSTLNQLLKGEPLPPGRTGPGYAESRARAADGVRRYWAAQRPAREAERAAISAAAAAQIGEPTDREIVVAGAVAYWCEGAKSKPYRIDEQVRFVNSDPALIKFFLAFLDKAGVSRERLRYCISIHECRRRGGHQVLGERDGRSAASVHPARDQAPHAEDIEAGRQRGLSRLSADIRDQEQPVVPRNIRLVAWRHDRKAAVAGTTRKNTSDGYHGCLRVDVKRSCVLYRKIEGWVSAVTGVAAARDYVTA